MMKIWDISRTLAEDLAPWPGDTPFQFNLTTKIAEGAVVNLGAMSTSVHNGTHADAPFHFDAKGDAINQVRLEAYLGRAVVIDLVNEFSDGRRDLIEIEHLERHAKEIAETSRVLIRTKVWRDSTVFPGKIPVIASGVAEWMQTKKVKLLGLDLPSVDAIDAKVLKNHHALARWRIAIIESLDLCEVEAGIYNFAALPLKISSGDGAPVRAVLWRE